MTYTNMFVLIKTSEDILKTSPEDVWLRWMDIFVLIKTNVYGARFKIKNNFFEYKIFFCCTNILFLSTWNTFFVQHQLFFVDMKHFFEQHQLVFAGSRLLFVQRQTFCLGTKLFFLWRHIFVLDIVSNVMSWWYIFIFT